MGSPSTMTGVITKRKLGHRLAQRKDHVKIQGEGWAPTCHGERPQKKTTLLTT